MGSTVGRPLTAGDVMTAAEVATLLAPTAIDRRGLGATRHLPSKKVGRRRLYVRSGIEALLLDDDGETAGETRSRIGA